MLTYETIQDNILLYICTLHYTKKEQKFGEIRENILFHSINQQ